MYGCASVGMSASWKVDIGVGCFSSVISTIHKNADGYGEQPSSLITSSSDTTMMSRLSILKGIRRHVCVGHGKGGLQSRPDTNLGFVMSSMSRITNPPCQ